MADEKTVVKGQEEKQNFFTKLINFFKKLPGAIARPFKNMWHELRKVTWPSRQDVVKYSLIVLVFLVFMGVVIGLLDLGSTALVKAITPAAPVVEATEEAHDHEHDEVVVDETSAEEAVESVEEVVDETVTDAEPAADAADAPAAQEEEAAQQ